MTSKNCLAKLDVVFKEKMEASEATGKARPRLVAISMKSSGFKVVAAAVSLGVLATACTLCIPVLFSELMTALVDPSATRTELWIFACGFFVLPVIASLAMQHAQYYAQVHGVRTRASLCAAVYRKALTVDMSRRKAGSLDLNVGTIVNLLSTDTELVVAGSRYAVQLVTVPLLIVTAVVLLYIEVEWAALVGLVFMLLMGPANGKLMGKIYALYFAKMRIADSRMKVRDRFAVWLCGCVAVPVAVAVPVLTKGNNMSRWSMNC